MMLPVERKTLHQLFLVTVFIKGLVGLLQVVGGVAMFLVSRTQLAQIAVLLTRPELAEDPSDAVATFILNSAAHFSLGAQSFASIYLVSHGLIKLILVVALLRRQMWSYPVSLWVLGAFIVYQCYRYTQTQSIWLVLLTVLDVIVVLLIWREYQLRKTVGFAH